MKFKSAEVNVGRIINKLYDLMSEYPELKSAVVEENRQKGSPNFWDILEYGTTVNQKEKSAHERRYSRILRWFLDPKENHHLQNDFVNMLLEKHADKKIDNLVSTNTLVETEKRYIDIFYDNPEHSTCIAIEVKQYSSEHSYADTKKSQLAEYREYVEKTYGNKNIESYRKNRYYFFLTVNGDSTKDPIEADKWVSIEYQDIIDIIQTISQNSKNLDFIKIKNDFISDLQKTIRLYNNEVWKQNIKENEIITQKDLEPLYRALFDSESESEEELEEYGDIRAKFYGFATEKMRSSENPISVEDLKSALEIVYIAISKQVQDKTPNLEVQNVICKIFREYTNTKEDPSPDTRMLTTKTDSYNIIKSVRRTGGKGQGLMFYPNAGKTEGEHYIYFSGDSKGALPNDGFRFIFDDSEDNSKPPRSEWRNGQYRAKELVSNKVALEEFMEDFNKELQHLVDMYSIYSQNE